MSPHETLFLGETHNVEIQRIANNDFVQFQTWDFGGYSFKTRLFNLYGMIVYLCMWDRQTDGRTDGQRDRETES
jgi:hypothetical protein